MAYKISQGSGARRTIGVLIAVALNIGFFFGLQAGLIQKAITAIETQVAAVKEPPPPPPENEPPPPPPPVEQPPPYVPPPDIVIATTQAPTTAIQQITTTRPPPDRAAIGRRVTLPPYPETSKENCEEGIVTLKLSIDESGRVVNVTLVKSSGFPALDNSALKEAMRWRYSPARKDGKPYASDLTINVKFQLRDSLTKRAYEECERRNRNR